MKIIKGDLIKMTLDGKFDVIIHGCNCFVVMGGGIAKQIKEAFPEAYAADCETVKGDKTKLGMNTYAKVGDVIIVNGYTQFTYQRKVSVDYDAIRSVFEQIYFHFKGTTARIGYPLIGCGLAGGDWDIVSKIIDEELKELDHTLVEWDG